MFAAIKIYRLFFFSIPEKAQLLQLKSKIPQVIIKEIKVLQAF